MDRATPVQPNTLASESPPCREGWSHVSQRAFLCTDAFLQRDIWGWQDMKRVNEGGREGIGIRVRPLRYEIAAQCVFSCPCEQSTLAEEDRC